MRKVTFAFTLASILLCVFHYLGFDPKNMMLFSLSVPLWFVPIFTSIENVNIFFAYAITIGFWLLLGYLVDQWVYRHRQSRIQS